MFRPICKILQRKGAAVNGLMQAISMSLNVNKAKEILVDFRRTQAVYFPVNINISSVEINKNIKFLGFIWWRPSPGLLTSPC